MVPALELTDEEVLERLKKILKGVSVISHPVPEYHADNPPPVVSCFSSTSTFILYISFVACTFIFLTLLLLFYPQEFGRNFIDPIPVDDLPSGAKVVGNLARVSSISKSQATIVLPFASIAEIIPYVEYVPRLVPRAPRSGKRTRANDASARSSSIKKSHQHSTRPGTQVIGSMLLGDHFEIFVIFVVCSCSQPSTFSFLRWYSGRVARG
jgi:hypothetical protein